MADDQKDQNNSENSDSQNDSESQNVSESEAQTSDTSIPSDTSGTQSHSESSEQKPTPKTDSANLKKIIEQIEKLSVLELADLVHGLEDKFGVSASSPVATAPASTGQVAGGEAEPEKTTFNVILSASGVNKIAVIKAVRELLPTLGLKEAKDLVEAAPKPVLEGVNKETAGEAKSKLEAAGGSVELQ